MCSGTIKKLFCWSFGNKNDKFGSYLLVELDEKDICFALTVEYCGDWVNRKFQFFSLNFVKIQSQTQFFSLPKMLWSFSVFLVIASMQNFDVNSHTSMRSVRCSINETFVLKNYSCFAKSYSRNVSTMNVRVYFKKPLKRFFVKFCQELNQKNLTLIFSDDRSCSVQVWNDLSGSHSFKKERLVQRSSSWHISGRGISSSYKNFQSWSSRSCSWLSIQWIFDEKFHFRRDCDGKCLSDGRLQAALPFLGHQWSFGFQLYSCHYVQIIVPRNIRLKILSPCGRRKTYLFIDYD